VITRENIIKLSGFKTPFYFYDIELLEKTLQQIKAEADKYNYIVHYALKANYNPKILNLISSYGFGADCVSGNEISRALECGFQADKIVFAGVGKTDEEICLALNKKIFSMNCESLEEMEVVNEISSRNGIIAPVFIRINPDIQAATHKYITTGIAENKFGIHLMHLDNVLNKLNSLKNIELKGFHFHIGSQIQDFSVFRLLCEKINGLQNEFSRRGINLEHINVGGGLGIDYLDPISNPIPDFAEFFNIFKQHLQLKKGQHLHFELGRAIVGQCGTVISKVLFVKQGISTSFAIVDAAMTDLLRPALYSAIHKIENLTSTEIEHISYDVVGPVCESSDIFGKDIILKKTHRNDLLAIYSAGAYGQVMSSNYNLRKNADVVYSDEIDN
jgi:diaminopimelate decarboxylase